MVPWCTIVVLAGVGLVGAHGDEHAFTYTVEFTNTGSTAVQMLTRHWAFADADGKVEEIKGPGARGAGT